MSRDEWLKLVLADRPPLTLEQVSRLRPILAPVASHAAPAAQQGPRSQNPHENRKEQHRHATA